MKRVVSIVTNRKDIQHLTNTAESYQGLGNFCNPRPLRLSFSLGTECFFPSTNPLVFRACNQTNTHRLGFFFWCVWFSGLPPKMAHEKRPKQTKKNKTNSKTKQTNKLQDKPKKDKYKNNSKTNQTHKQNKTVHKYKLQIKLKQHNKQEPQKQTNQKSKNKPNSKTNPNSQNTNPRQAVRGAGR